MVCQIRMEEPHHLSPLEQLPRELARIVFDYAPNCIYTLRKTSKTAQMLVYEYAMTQKELVDNLSIRGHADFLIEVSNCNSKMFELCLSLHIPPHFIRRIRRLPVGLCHTSKEYHFEYKSKNDDIIVQYLSECMGRSISRVELFFNRPQATRLINRVLNGKMVKQVSINCPTLSVQEVIFVLKMTKNCRVVEISIAAQSFKADDPEQFFLQLSSSVKGLKIHQKHTDESDDQKLLWGIRNFDWTSVIFEMFSKRLDMLHIQSKYCLPDNLLEHIKMKLPKLKKRVLFEVLCKNVIEEVSSFTDNNHVVECKCSYLCGYLSVKHTSRVAERYHLF